MGRINNLLFETRDFDYGGDEKVCLLESDLQEIKLKVKAADFTEIILRYDTSQKTGRLYLPVPLIIMVLPDKR
jgi:hypothetical protein